VNECKPLPRVRLAPPVLVLEKPRGVLVRSRAVAAAAAAAAVISLVLLSLGMLRGWWGAVVVVRGVVVTARVGK